MTLVQLRHLVSLADSGSFSRSAKSMFITQPALSRSIRALEDELGQPLFDRIGRRTELTPFGREFAARAQQIVFDADDLRASALPAGQGRTGSLRMGLGSGPGALLMTPLLVEVATRHPQLRLNISRGRTDGLVEALRARLLDALVVDARSLVPAPDLRTDVLREIRGAFLCRPGHPLTNRRRRITFADVRRYPIGSTPLSDEIARALVERYGADAHPQRCVTLRCEEIPSLVEMARASDAVLLTVRAAAADLVELPLKPALDATARFGLVTLAGRTEAPALSIVRRCMRDLLHD